MSSQINWYWLGASTPLSSTPSVWLKTTKDATEADPTHGSPIGWYLFDGTNWAPFNNIVRSGTTAERPTGPVEYQQYYDTTISVLIWWERNAWRTVSGVPGDIKSVAFNTLVDALTYNPGWDVLGASNEDIRGRFISQATKDAAGSGGTTDLSVGANISVRQAFETINTTSKFKIDNTAAGVALQQGIAFWHLVKL